MVSTDARNAALARSLLDYALRTDTFPGLERPRRHVTLAIAANASQFREWIGPTVPEWGSAVAFPSEDRIVMQGRGAGSRAGDPLEVLRHELAHLALHEALGDLTPRWFDEGYASYAAHEWSREDALRANLALAIRGAPRLDELERWFSGGAARAEAAYALAYRAVAELADLDPQRGLTVLFAEWSRTRKLDTAIRNAYGMTLAGFEMRWRDRTRRRYGGLALLADVTIAGLFVFVIVMPLYVARRRRDRHRLMALRAADEVAERAARESALEALLEPDRERGGPATPGDGPAPQPGEAR
ncbi:MAG: peptidase MA family metallohydrolase [Gemmatimonadaceae bacterium]